MSSRTTPRPLDLDRDLPTTDEDVRRLRELKRRPKPDFAAYLEILSRTDLSWIPHRRKPLRCPELFEL
ncbi:MAG: hypothetical protein GY719_29835 [bacterium]|nr:hypothetical protein [bacterium]